MANVNDIYFDGYYKDIWRSIIPEQLTIRETDFMVEHFALQPGDHVLDLMCGYGRHALALGRKGIRVTAIDNLADYINEVVQSADAESLPVFAECREITSWQSPDPGQADLVICMGNSLNFFPEPEMLMILSNSARALKQGGRIFINSWSLAEIAIPDFLAKSWGYVNGLRYITENQYLFFPTRIETEHLILTPDGKSETKSAVDYIFSISEMEKLLSAAGFGKMEVYSIPGKKKFAIGDKRAYIIAEKS